MTQTLYTAQEVDLLLAPITQHLAEQDSRVAVLEASAGVNSSAILDRLAALESVQGSTTTDAPDVYSSVDLQWTQMAIGSGTQSLWYVARRATIPDVKKDDVLLVTGRGQITNDTTWNVELAELLTIHTASLASFYSDTTPELYGIGSQQPITGHNISPAEHHSNWNVHEPCVVLADAPILYVTYWLRGRCSLANGNNGILTIDRTQARMRVLHWRP